MPETSDDRAARWRAYRAALSPEARKRHVEALAVRREAHETRLRASVDKAVTEALKKLPQMIAELSETAPAAPPPPVLTPPPVVPAQPFHDMTPEEFRSVADQVWSQQGAAMRSPAWQQRRPMTVSELIAGRYEDDGEA
jgi:hypothetical protein